MRILRTAALVIFLATPLIAAATWTCWPALRAYVATRLYQLPRLTEQDWSDSQKSVETRRGIQRHFLSYNVYIPLEDIIITTPSETEANELALLMQKACGRGRLYVWIPLKFRVPISGEKVIEWCWKPQVSSNT